MLRHIPLVTVLVINSVAFVRCDDVVPLLHIVSGSHHDVNAGLRVSFAAAEAAASRAEQLLLLGVDEMRKKRSGKIRAEISGKDLFSVAAKKFIKAISGEEADRSAVTETSNTEPDPPTVTETTTPNVILMNGTANKLWFSDFPAVIAAVLDLILFAVTYYVKPEWHCQPLLVLYWWTIGVLVMVHDQELTVPDALEVLVEMATTIGYGSNPPRSSGLMFWHSMHAMTALTTGLNEAMDSLADYIINNLDRFMGSGVFEADNRVASEECLEDETRKDELNVEELRSAAKSDTDNNKDITVWVSDADFWAAASKDEDGKSDSATRAGFICSRAVLVRRLTYRLLSCVLFVAVTTLYLTMDFFIVDTQSSNLGPEREAGKDKTLSLTQRMGNALYVAVISMSTVGYGDISPASQGMRLLAPIILNGLTHDFARFCTLIGEMKHEPDEDKTKDLTQNGLDFVAGTKSGHAASSHDLGIHNCPLLSYKYVQTARTAVEVAVPSDFQKMTYNNQWGKTGTKGECENDGECVKARTRGRMGAFTKEAPNCCDGTCHAKTCDEIGKLVPKVVKPEVVQAPDNDQVGKPEVVKAPDNDQVGKPEGQQQDSGQ